MKIHRFYVGVTVELKQNFWFHDKELLNQWNRVLRFKAGQKIVLFDSVSTDRMYEIIEITEREAHLNLITELKRQLPKMEVYLFWSLLKRDKNEWILQKCTELGVSNFVPIITERCERDNLSENRLERWQKIVTEAAEQCGRSDIPDIRNPINLSTVFDEYESKIKLIISEQGSEKDSLDVSEKIGILIGPEGGWSDAEKELFNIKKTLTTSLGDFTLRAETAAVTAVAKLLQ